MAASITLAQANRIIEAILEKGAASNAARSRSSSSSPDAR